MEKYWVRILNWLSKKAPYMINTISEGANLNDVKYLNNSINIRFPNDFVDFYMIHNGQIPYTQGLINGEELLCISRMLEEWSIWRQLADTNYFMGMISSPDKGIKNDWYNKLWIPITYDGAGNHYCLDLAPTDDGRYGQIIRVWHDNAQRSLEAPSFKKWIEYFVEDLETDRYKF